MKIQLIELKMKYFCVRAVALRILSDDLQFCSLPANVVDNTEPGLRKIAWLYLRSIV